MNPFDATGQFLSEVFIFISNPLKFYTSIAAFSLGHLKPKGSLFLEINQYLATQTKQLLVNNHFKEVDLQKDIFGNFRMLKGTRP